MFRGKSVNSSTPQQVLCMFVICACAHACMVARVIAISIACYLPSIACYQRLCLWSWHAANQRLCCGAVSELSSLAVCGPSRLNRFLRACRFRHRNVVVRGSQKFGYSEIASLCLLQTAECCLPVVIITRFKELLKTS